MPPGTTRRPSVGMRTLKTALTAALLAAVYCLLDRNPAFACIGVIFGMGADMKDSIKNGGNRLFGTLIGGLLSILLFRLYLLPFPEGGHSFWLAVLLGFGIVVLVQLCLRFWPGGRAARWGGALHRAVQHPGGQLRFLRSQPHRRHRRGCSAGAAGELYFSPAGCAGTGK